MNAGARVAAFAGGLAVVFGLAWVAGAAVGPLVGPVIDDEPEPMAGHGMAQGAAHAERGEHLPGGLAVARDGYRLRLADDVLRPGARELAFTVVGPDGAPVTAYEVEHEKRLHLIVVRRDFAGFQHVHPVLDEGSGEWTADVDLESGAWRVFADFVPAGGDDLTLGADLTVPGAVPAPAPVVEQRVAEVDGYAVALDGELHPGEDAVLTFEVTRDGEPVTDLEQYLGAAGHLVALRDGDLAYLHVHPGDGLEFVAEVPSPGTYHLFLDFQHDGVVRTAQLVVEAS
ncbi:hypothetical protein [Nocardioides pyridinolyticus]